MISTWVRPKSTSISSSYQSDGHLSQQKCLSKSRTELKCALRFSSLLFEAGLSTCYICKKRHEECNGFDTYEFGGLAGACVECETVEGFECDDRGWRWIIETSGRCSLIGCGRIYICTRVSCLAVGAVLMHRAPPPWAVSFRIREVLGPGVISSY